VAAATTADGDAGLARRYARHTGGRKDRWTVCASPTAVSTFRADLARSSVTRHSFRGRVRYSREPRLYRSGHPRHGGRHRL